MVTVSGGYEAQLVDGGDEGAEEEEVHEDDEYRGAFGGFESDERVQTPEDGDHGDDEEDEHVDGGDLVGFLVGIDEIGLRCSC